jgi:hypothetical protein
LGERGLWVPFIGYSTRSPYAKAMSMVKHMIAVVLAAGLSLPAVAQSRRAEADAAYQATRDGAVKPLRSIENGIVPRMKARGADYIGAEFLDANQRYRLKFMRGSSVIWVDVDGRSGAIVGRAGE